MKRSSFLCLLVLCLCVLWVFLLSHCAKKGKESVSTPDFTLKTLEGQEITLSKLKGKVVLLDFWATWCAPCRESIPHLVELYKTYGEKGLEVIGMNVDRGDTDTVRRFVKSMDIPYPIAVTPEEVSRDFGVTALPTTILIDKEGRLREKILGFNSAVVTAKVTDLASEKP
jgi:cytochrome c biogenesis protein CcmG/thiol:disulfide interchange protein DsbE